MFHLVRDFDKQAEALRGLEQEPVSDVLTEVLGLGARLHFKSLWHKTGFLSQPPPHRAQAQFTSN